MTTPGDSPTEPTEPTEPSADFTRIDGIGATTAALLQEQGYRTFQQLAEARVEQIVAGSAGRWRISAARILKEGWLEQAARLAEEETTELTPDGPEPGRPGRRSFTVE